MLVDGIAQEIGEERRDMRVTFVADHKQHDLSCWKLLKHEIMPDVNFVWARPNDLNHPRAYFEISLANEQLLMNPINVTSDCVPKDIKGSGAYTDPGQPELHTVLHHQWRYDTNWVKKLRDFDLLTHYNKRKLCESAL